MESIGYCICFANQENQCWEKVRVSTDSKTIRILDAGGPRDQETLVMEFAGFKQARIVTTVLGSNPTAINVKGKTSTDSGIRPFKLLVIQ